MMMMMTIDSTTLEHDSEKHLCISIPDSNSKEFDDINNNHPYPTEQPPFDCNHPMKSSVLSSNDTTLLTTTTTRLEVKVKTTNSSVRKRKLDLIHSNNNEEKINQRATMTKKKQKKPRMAKVDSDVTMKQQRSVDQSSGTDQSSFGSCEPGTSVVLQGIVWNETDKGVLVVNITWRGKTYVGALLNTTEQNWAPPRYKSDVRSSKANHHRDHQLTIIPPIHEPTERILRNGKRRGSSTTVTPSSAIKTRSFKTPETPVSLKNGETSINVSKNEKILVPSSTNLNDDDEIGDNSSSRSVSPTTSGISTASSSPPLSTNNENQSNSKSIIESEEQSKTKEALIPYHFSNDMLFPSSINSFTLPSFNKLSPTSSTISPSSYLPVSSQLYFNSLTSSHYPPVSSPSNLSR